MELKQYAIHRKYQKGNVAGRVTVSEDYSIPEGKSDIYKVLWKDSKVEIEEVQAEKGKIRVRGRLKIWILYRTERSKKNVDSLLAEFLFDEILYMEEASNGDYLKIEWNMEELNITVIHPGKIGIRAIVTLQGTLTASEEKNITENIEAAPDIFLKKETLTVADALNVSKESYRIKEEISLPANKPNVERILWKNVQLQHVEMGLMDGSISVKGEMMFLVVYESQENEDEIAWMEQTVPFQGTLEVSGVTPEMFGLLKAEETHQKVEVHPDYDGEMRSFSIELLIDISLQLYENKKLLCVADAYSTKKQLQLKREQMVYEKQRMCSFVPYRISGLQNPGGSEEPEKILNYQACFKNAVTKPVEGGVLWESVLEIQILYEKSGGECQLGSMTMSVPCSQFLEIQDLQKGDWWKVNESIGRLSVSITDRNEFSVQGNVRLDYCVIQLCEFLNVSEITEEDYDAEKYKNEPGMKIHFVQPGETLWEIAKNNRCTVEELKQRGGLSTEEPVPGQKLLIVKPSAAGVAFMV